MKNESIHVHVPPPTKRTAVLFELAKMGRVLAEAINSPTASVVISGNTISDSDVGISIDTEPRDMDDNLLSGGE